MEREIVVGMRFSYDNVAFEVEAAGPFWVVVFEIGGGTLRGTWPAEGFFKGVTGVTYPKNYYIKKFFNESQD